MLELIIKSSRADLCQIFVPEANTMRSNIGATFLSGEGVASAIASNEAAVKAAVEKVNSK